MATPTTVSSTPDVSGGQKAIDGTGGMASPSTVSSTPPLGKWHAIKKQTTSLRDQGEEPRRSFVSSGKVKKTANFAEEDDAGTGRKNLTPRRDEAGGNVDTTKGAWKTAAMATKMLGGSVRDKVVPDSTSRADRGNALQKPESKLSSVIKKASKIASKEPSRMSYAPKQEKQSIRPRKEALFAWCEGKEPKSSSNSAANRCSLMARPYRGAGESERCSRCTREAVWTACDVFWTFDPTWFAWATGTTNTGPSVTLEHPREITREGYIAALSFAPTVDRLRMLRRSGLEQRFRKSAQPVDLREWLRMIWPAATNRDMNMMHRWAKLREAWSIVHNRQFRSTDNELNRIFDLLCESADGKVAVGEFVRAQLMQREECQKLFRKIDLHFRINKESEKSVLQSHFKTHVNAETQRRMKQEEEAMISNVSNWMGIVEKKGVQ